MGCCTSEDVEENTLLRGDIVSEVDAKQQKQKGGVELVGAIGDASEPSSTASSTTAKPSTLPTGTSSPVKQKSPSPLPQSHAVQDSAITNPLHRQHAENQSQPAPVQQAPKIKRHADFMTNIYGYWKNSTGSYIFYFSREGVTMTPLPGSLLSFQCRQLREEHAKLIVTNKLTNDEMTFDLTLQGENLLLSFQLDEDVNSLLLSFWPNKEREEQLMAALGLLSEVNEKVLENELRAIESRYLVSLAAMKRSKDATLSGLVTGLLAKLLPASELLVKIQVEEKQAQSTYDPTIIGDWALTQGKVEHIFTFNANGDVVMPNPKNSKMPGVFVTDTKSQPNRIECLMKDEKKWRKGIYKVEQNSLTMQWSANDDFPAQFSTEKNKVFTLQRVIKKKGDPIALSLEFLDRFEAISTKIVQGLTAPKEVKEQFVNIIYQIQPLPPLIEGTDIHNVAKKHSPALLESLRPLENEYGMQWHALVTSTQPDIEARVKRSVQQVKARI